MTSRTWHAITAAVSGSAVLLQLVLTISGGLPNQAAATTGMRLVRFIGYFTIESNVLVCAATLWLALGHGLVTLPWRAVRLAGLVGITATGVVYLVALRPLNDVHGWAALADAGLHYVTPVLAVLGWVAFGPRERIDGRVVLTMLVWPAAWGAWLLANGAITGYYPYPFINARDRGYLAAVLDLLAVAGVLVALALLARVTDNRLAQREPAWRR